ncbi:hypothetical protein JCM14467A_05620 [Vulcanisaeta sp. JCM 14467]
MNELVRELRINEIVNALMTAFRAGNRDYISSAAELLHEEFTYTVSESTELTGDTLRRASILHALYCLSLGMLRLMSGESIAINPVELLRVAVNDGDLSHITQSLIAVSALLIKGDSSWLGDFRDLVQGIGDGLIKGMLLAFLDIAGLIKSPDP